MNEEKPTVRILVVDDSPEDQAAYRRYLEKDRDCLYRIIEAYSGEEGLESFRRVAIDCVLLDYRLPDLDGLEFLAELANASLQISVPVVLLTGQGSEAIAVQAMKGGAMDYLVKDSLTVELLTRTIRHAIRKKQADTALLSHYSFLNTLLDTIPNPIFYKDVNGVYLGCNKAFEELTGYPREKIIGRTVYDIAHKRFACEHDEIDRNLFRHPGVQTYETPVRNADGSLRRIMFNKASYASTGNEVDGLVGVMIDLTEQKEAEKKIRHLALHDTLTDLPNRRLFFDRLDQALSRAHRFQQFVALLYIDLDGFKCINDSFGHEAGDKVLKEVAQKLIGCLRETDTAARLGGDEFAVILQDLKEIEFVEYVAQRIVASLVMHFGEGSTLCRMSASVGISVYPSDGRDASTLLKNADAAMYTVKKRGKGGYSFHIS